MKSKIYEFDPEIYPFPIHITKDFDKEELKSIYKALDVSENEIPITDELDATESTTARVLNVVETKSGKLCYLVLCFRPDAIGAGIAAHESVHLANAYLQYLGFTPQKAYDDEPYAYFVGWVTNCIWTVLVDEPNKMKGVLLKYKTTNKTK